MSCYVMMSTFSDGLPSIAIHIYIYYNILYILYTNIYIYIYISIIIDIYIVLL